MPIRTSGTTNTAYAPQPDGNSQRECPPRTGTTNARARNETFSSLQRDGARRTGATAGSTHADASAAPQPAKSGASTTGAKGTDRLESFLRRARAGQGNDASPNVPPSQVRPGGAKPASSGTRFRRPSGNANFTYGTYRKPSSHYAGPYAGHGFTAHGYPQTVRPTSNRFGYVSRMFGAGQPLGFTYGFGQIAHGARMHFGFHFNGRFLVLHLGVRPGTSQPLFAHVNSGYTYPLPTRWGYPAGLYAHPFNAWHPGYGYGHAHYPAHSRPGHYGTGVPPRAAQGAPRPQQARPQRARPQTGPTPQRPRPQGAAGQGGPKPEGARPRPASTVNQQPPKGFRNWHEVLGVPHGSATRDAIRARYRKEALRLHPDKNQGTDTTAAFQELQWACTTAMAVLDARERGLHVPVPAPTGNAAAPA